MDRIGSDFFRVVTQIKNTLIQWIRKIPLMEKFGMTAEEEADLDRRTGIRKEINKLARWGGNKMEDTHAIAGILETASRTDIAALLQGDKLSEKSRLELASLFNENKQLYEEIKTAKDKLNATIITQGGSTQTTVNSTTVAIAKGATDSTMYRTEASLANKGG